MHARVRGSWRRVNELPVPPASPSCPASVRARSHAARPSPPSQPRRHPGHQQGRALPRAGGRDGLWRGRPAPAHVLADLHVRALHAVRGAGAPGQGPPPAAAHAVAHAPACTPHTDRPAGPRTACRCSPRADTHTHAHVHTRTRASPPPHHPPSPPLSSVSYVPPAYYAHLAAFRGRTLVSSSDSSSDISGVSGAWRAHCTAAPRTAVPALHCTALQCTVPPCPALPCLRAHKTHAQLTCCCPWHVPALCRRAPVCHHPHGPLQ